MFLLAVAVWWVVFIVAHQVNETWPCCRVWNSIQKPIKEMRLPQPGTRTAVLPGVSRASGP